MNQKIRLGMPNLLMMHFRLHIPLGVHLLVIWLSTIQFIIVRSNVTTSTTVGTNLREFGVEKISVLVIMFDRMLRLVTWHCEFYFLNRINTCIPWIGWLISLYITLHFFDVISESHNIVYSLSSSFPLRWKLPLLKLCCWLSLTLVETLLLNIMSSFLMNFLKILESMVIDSMVFYSVSYYTWSS